MFPLLANGRGKAVLGPKALLCPFLCMRKLWGKERWAVQFCQSIMSDYVWPHGPQNTRLPCPSPTLGACSNSFPSSRCHPTISSSVIPFSRLQSFPASGSFQMSQFFASGGQSIGTSASASILPMNIQGWFPLGLTGLISLLSKGLSRIFSSTTVQKHQFFDAQLSFRGDIKTRDKQAAKERPSQNFQGCGLLGICCLKWSQPSNLQHVNTGIVKYLSC